MSPNEKTQKYSAIQKACTNRISCLRQIAGSQISNCHIAMTIWQERERKTQTGETAMQRKKDTKEEGKATGEIIIGD